VYQVTAVHRRVPTRKRGKKKNPGPPGRGSRRIRRRNKTYANIPPIIRTGGDWYAKIGTEKSKGTKVFALAGRVRNTGLVEVPVGITLREIVFEIGGGIPDGRQFKAVQTGGPSGGCIPADFLDMRHNNLDMNRGFYRSLGTVCAGRT
jgi:NADH:ubiquinone oxidoreductase subunit F (NADH-binding)